ncbi:transposase [Lacisediminimonas sp.]|uniref:IS66-like element accessory protein TnpA n=1 Tax=Lacisediminimonas sp. TaxID=3060582 RepID=UPI002718973E|nr:transposase [Lacisediminimonas sp.]MDO8300651.1 transposase [Lacisediminimonas sp.]
MHAIPTPDPIERRTRRRHSREFKASVVAACKQPGASVAAVALANAVNANLARRWIVEHDRAARVGRQEQATLPTPGFLPVQLAPTHQTMQPVQPIRIDLRQGQISMTVTWPTSAAHDCANWIKALLR